MRANAVPSPLGERGTGEGYRKRASGTIDLRRFGHFLEVVGTLPQLIRHDLIQVLVANRNGYDLPGGRGIAT